MSWLEDIVTSIKYMENNITEELTLEKVAAEVNLSPFYFHRGFSILCGVTVSEYIRNRRLSLAGRNLQTDGCKECPQFWTDHFEKGKGKYICGIYGICLEDGHLREALST